jgi:hypothetical protein
MGIHLTVVRIVANSGNASDRFVSGSVEARFGSSLSRI